MQRISMAEQKGNAATRVCYNFYKSLIQCFIYNVTWFTYFYVLLPNKSLTYYNFNN